MAAIKIKDLETLEKRDPKLYAIIKAAEAKAEDVSRAPMVDEVKEEKKARKAGKKKPVKALPVSSEYVYMKEPDTVRAFIFWVQTLAVLGTAVCIIFNSLAAPTGTLLDTCIVMGWSFLYFGPIVWLASVVLMMPFITALERNLPSGEGKWVVIKPSDDT